MKINRRKLVLIVTTIWICITGAFLYWTEINTERVELLLAQGSAKAFFQQIVISRLWNAAHGGVYVPITAKTQPNKYLLAKDRDLTTTNGLKLTKVTPAHMTRQLAELAKKRHCCIQFHITSLKPIRPENKATNWEKAWLKSFEHGIKERGEFFKVGDITWFRYMAPLLTEAECLKCHVNQGYKIGDIHGGISISLPYPTHTHLYLLIGYSSVVIIGLIFIFIGVNLYERKQRLFDATFNSPVPTSITDKNFKILMANESYWAEFGPLPKNQTTIKCYEHRPGKSCHTKNCPLIQIMNGSSTYSYESVKIKADQTSQYFIITAKPLFNARGKVTGVVESFQDITKRKRSEEALKKFNHKLENLSKTDGLTEIANRRHFDEVLTQEHARHVRSGEKLSLILLDIDHFKLFNDYYGHVNGDKCLKQIAQVIDDCAARSSDLVARYGGEEFACILPKTDSNGAVILAERIRRAIISCAIPHQVSNVADYVTASLGVVTVQCTAGESVLDIVARVDKCLYLAKAKGRNRVESGHDST